jgi:ubiquinone/menaquinone biosynthesis C-methylase UbiE
MSRLFNKGNADLNDLVKDLLELQEQDSVLEIGFGPGTLIHQMAQITTQGVVEGIDFSETMLTLASETNKQFIASGRVKLQRGNCNAMPYSDESFDKVCTANTIYFWENPNETFKEISRVVKSGGKLVVGFRDKDQMKDLPLSKEVFSYYTTEEVKTFLSNAGFTDVQIVDKPGQPFVSQCAVANKS